MGIAGTQIEIKINAPSGTGMVILFSSRIDRQKNSVLTTTILFNLPSLRMHLYRWSWCLERLLYKTRCSWWNSVPAIPFDNIQSSLAQPTCHSKGNSTSYHYNVVAFSLWYVTDLLQIEAQEHDPSHTLLQQCVSMHFKFQTPVRHKNFFFARPLILLLLPLVITFLPPRCHFIFYSTTTNERMN
jgi:hypothetical protein